MRVLAQLVDFLGREAAALVEHRRGRKVRRDDEERIRHMRAVDVARRGGHGRIELEHRFGRLFLVPQRHRQHAAVVERAHVGFHRLLRIGELLDDGEAAGIGEPDGIGQTQIDDVEALVGLREEVAPFVIDDAHLAEDVAGEILDDGIAEGGEHGAIALGDRHVLGARAQGERGRNAAAELGDEGLGRLLDHVGVVHRQVTEIGGVLGRQIADDADRPVAVDVEREIGVGGHLRQIEAGVVREARREMQVGARIGLEIAERRSALVDLLARRGTCARRRRPCSR